jgi:hypothetical protein
MDLLALLPRSFRLLLVLLVLFKDGIEGGVADRGRLGCVTAVFLLDLERRKMIRASAVITVS